MTKLDIGPPPETGFDVTPSAEEVEFFRDNGFLVVDQLTTQEELDWLTVHLRAHLRSGERDEPGRAGRPHERRREDGPRCSRRRSSRRCTTRS